MICKSDQCFCEPGYVAKFDRTVSHWKTIFLPQFIALNSFQACLPNADYNDGCLESGQCQVKLGEGAICEQGKCVCGEDFLRITFIVANGTNSTCEERIGEYITSCWIIMT